MNLILEDSPRMPYHTFLREIFRALGGRQREFVWLITDLMICGNQLAQTHNIENDEILLMTGDALTEIVEEHDPQVVWGVLSGFHPGTEPNPAHLAILPRAEDNPRIWEPNVQIQYPTALVEIVGFDSSLTLFLSRDEDLSRRFKTHFPEASDLNEYNRRLWKQKLQQSE